MKDLDVPEIINFSTKHNCFVITPPKTGSRNLTRILQLYDFHSYGIDQERFILVNYQPIHNHTLKFMENHLQHEVMISCRNPYAIYASLFRLKMIGDQKILSTFNLQKEFHEFMLEYLFIFNHNDPWIESSNNKYLKMLLARKIDYRIKLENFKESIFQVPFVSNSTEDKIDKVSRLTDERFGDHLNMKLFNSHAKKYFPNDFKLYYNNENAELVFENFRSKFIIMDYHKDSWML